MFKGVVRRAVTLVREWRDGVPPGWSLDVKAWRAGPALSVTVTIGDSFGPIGCTHGIVTRRKMMTDEAALDDWMRSAIRYVLRAG